MQKVLVRLYNIWLKYNCPKEQKGKNCKVQGKFNNYFLIKKKKFTAKVPSAQELR